MKTMVRCLVITILAFATTNVTEAQLFNRTNRASIFGPTANGQGFGQAFNPLSLDILSQAPGRVWFGINAANQGLGYSGSYATVGMKKRILEDRFGGRLLLETRGHISLENGEFFSNVGIMRVVSLRSAGADLTFGFWIDYDGDAQGNFSHDFYQSSLNFSIDTQRNSIVGNVYYPVRETDFSFGGGLSTTGPVFAGNMILLQPGVDSALRGYDALFRTRPSRLDFINGTVEVGGYSYQSDLVDSFAGFRIGMGFQAISGTIVNVHLNQDSRFSTTAAVQLTTLFGGNAAGTEYSIVGRDLEPTIRNDHIVRFQQDYIAAIDPDTGIPITLFTLTTRQPALARVPLRIHSLS